ncbi:uncharacterized protein LOC122644755 [Telopea speciosissima]|uniref:uncharacterized protein LOC122644755 n=1 Tax=Telopea speciosissima TaxID=54955 RepID=UPI001CC568E7|nr:uncharacterized protein LOC122644755 [Telopea speciosissima]
MDMLGPFPKATGGRQFMVVAVDYFTKWVEAEALATICTANACKFFLHSIIYRYGISRTLITDNGKQFEQKFKEFSDRHEIQLCKTLVAHPQSNDLAEDMNKILLDGIKNKLETAKGLWVEELPNILWAYRTITRLAIGETPFMLMYGTEAVIPMEIRETSLRVQLYNPETNGEELRTNLDLLEEFREIAGVKNAAHLQRVARHYNAKVKPRIFHQGDLVLHKLGRIIQNLQTSSFMSLSFGDFRGGTHTTIIELKKLEEILSVEVNPHVF